MYNLSTARKAFSTTTIANTFDVRRLSRVKQLNNKTSQQFKRDRSRLLNMLLKCLIFIRLNHENYGKSLQKLIVFDY